MPTPRVAVSVQAGSVQLETEVRSDDSSEAQTVYEVLSQLAEPGQMSAAFAEDVQSMSDLTMEASLLYPAGPLAASPRDGTSRFPRDGARP